jgi:hypothetical protein
MSRALGVSSRGYYVWSVSAVDDSFVDAVEPEVLTLDVRRLTIERAAELFFSMNRATPERVDQLHADLSRVRRDMQAPLQRVVSAAKPSCPTHSPSLAPSRVTLRYQISDSGGRKVPAQISGFANEVQQPIPREDVEVDRAIAPRQLVAEDVFDLPRSRERDT